MRANLFSTLYRSAGGRQLENFATASLAWLLERDPAVRGAFFASCRQVSGGDDIRSVLTKLAPVPIRAVCQSSIEIKSSRRRYLVRPDLQIVDRQDRYRILVEVKAFARPTFHDLDDDEGVDQNLRRREATRVPQTKLYRDWINDNHPGSALLFALTRENDRNPLLTAPCHGCLDWTMLRAAILRERSAHPDPGLTTDFCDFLVEEKIVTPQYEPLSTGDAEALQNAAAVRWDKWETLLDLAVLALQDELARDGGVRDLAVKGKKISFWRDIGEERWNYSLWKKWIEGTCSNRNFWVTPCIVVDAGEPTRLGFDIGLLGWNALTIGNLLQGVPVEPSDDGGVFCWTPLPEAFHSAADLKGQAQTIATSGFSEILRPLLAVARKRRSP